MADAGENPSAVTGESVPNDDHRILEMRAIVKTFPGVRALDGVDLDLKRGEVLAVLGENGAGKSTLMKILSGDYQRDSGEILIDGESVDLQSPADAMASGIAMIYQELNSVPDVSVGENVALGALPERRLAGLKFVDWGSTHAAAREWLAKLGADIDPRQRMRWLDVAERQIVEIAKALRSTARILVMDEPTAPLADREVGRLFDLIHTLTEEGVSIIYISHRLGEVFEIADRALVLRDGRVSGVFDPKESTWDDLVRAMVGRDLQKVYPRKQATKGDVVMRVDGLTSATAFRDVSFEVRAGEIVGIFGLLGSGSNELIRALFGAHEAVAGELHLFEAGHPDTPVISGPFASPGAARDAGIGLIPLDRKQEGLVLEMDVSSNTTLGAAERYARYGLLRRWVEDERARHWVDRLHVRTPSVRQKVRLLSGGNQQKVVLSRWLEAGSRVLVMDEPTRGVDVGARVDIYRILEELVEEGAGIVMSSTDLPEITSLADRIVVLHDGDAVATVEREEIDQARLLHLAQGVTD
jgi:ribose transport system ATP-binding protein